MAATYGPKTMNYNIFRDEITKTIIARIPFDAPQTQFYTLVWWPKSCKVVQSPRNKCHANSV